MAENASKQYRFNWLLPLYAALGAFIVFVPVAIWTSEPFFYVFVVCPIIILVFGILLVVATITKKWRRSFSITSMLVSYLLISAVLLAEHEEIRSTGRWLLWSPRYKASVLAQPDSVNGGFKHIEWDGWGFPGAGETTVFLVFDPTDSLALTANSRQPATLIGIPCKVPRVRRLESQWYSVRFYTHETWGQCAGGKANKGI